MSTNGKKLKHLTRLQTLDIGNFLREKCIKGDDGYYNYLDGLSDEAVAEKFGVTKNSIAGLRGEVCGKLKPATRPSPEDTLTEVQGRVIVLEKENSELRVRLQNVEKVVDLLRPLWDTHYPSPPAGSLKDGTAQTILPFSGAKKS